MTAVLDPPRVRPFVSAFLPDKMQPSESRQSFHERQPQPSKPSPWAQYKKVNNDQFERTAAAIVVAPSPASLLDVVKQSSQTHTGTEVKYSKQRATDHTGNEAQQSHTDQHWANIYPSGRRARSVKILEKQAQALKSWQDSTEQIRLYRKDGNHHTAIEVHDKLVKKVHQDLRNIEKDRAYKRLMFPTKSVEPPSMREIEDEMPEWERLADQAAPRLAQARLERAKKKHFPVVLDSSTMSHGPTVKADFYKHNVRNYLNQNLNERLYRHLAASSPDDVKLRNKFPAYFARLKQEQESM